MINNMVVMVMTTITSILVMVVMSFTKLAATMTVLFSVQIFMKKIFHYIRTLQA